MDNDVKIFDNVSFSDLTRDIYDNSKSKRVQLDLLIQEIHGFIQSIDDAVVVMPIVKEIFDVAIRNDEHLVKLASVLQRIVGKSNGASDSDTMMLSDAEKEELIATLQDTANDMQDESDKINKIKTNVPVGN
jgi:hypothetical protein|tara:strand:+ start:732 stop:1127 length:396 start_codon:yes stop_codon:yes gene_type:complete